MPDADAPGRKPRQRKGAFDMMIDPDFAAMRFDGSRLSRLRYAVKGRDRNGEERTLERVATRKEAAESKADFLRTRGGEFARVWIERTA